MWGNRLRDTIEEKDLEEVMRKTEQVIFTNMCMIYDGAGNVLIQNRRDPDWPGIAFPGGHVEAGESFTDAVIREVFEETGLTVSKLQMCGIKDWISSQGTRYVVLLYRTGTFRGTPVSSEEGEVWWVPLNRLQDMELAENMLSMLRVFCEETLTEQFIIQKGEEWTEVLK